MSLYVIACKENLQSGSLDLRYQDTGGNWVILVDVLDLLGMPWLSWIWIISYRGTVPPLGSTFRNFIVYML